MHIIISSIKKIKHILEQDKNSIDVHIHWIWSLSLLFLIWSTSHGTWCFIVRTNIYHIFRGDIWESSSSLITSQITSQYEFTNSPIGDSHRLNDLNLDKFIIHHFLLGFFHCTRICLTLPNSACWTFWIPCVYRLLLWIGIKKCIYHVQ